MDPKLFALVTATCFGLNPVTLKLGFGRGGRPDTAMIIGLFVAVPLYVALLPLAGGLHWEEVTVPALAGYTLGGLFGSGIGRRWLYTAIDLIGASPATAIKNAAPVISAVLGVLFFADPMTPLRWVAILLIVGGVILLTWQPRRGARHWVSVGALLAMGSAVSYGIRPLFIKFGLDAVDLPLTAALVGAIAALSYALWFGDRSGLRNAHREAGFALFVLSGVLQAVGFLALNLGLSGGVVSVVYPVTASAPLFTLGFTALLLRGREQLTRLIVGGATAIVLGVVLL
jgi:DME family drug/metabolite transporter